MKTKYEYENMTLDCLQRAVEENVPCHGLADALVDKLARLEWLEGVLDTLDDNGIYPDGLTFAELGEGLQGWRDSLACAVEYGETLSQLRDAILDRPDDTPLDALEQILLKTLSEAADSLQDISETREYRIG